MRNINVINNISLVDDIINMFAHITHISYINVNGNEFHSDIMYQQYLTC